MKHRNCSLEQDDLRCLRLVDPIDMRNELVNLATFIHWDSFERKCADFLPFGTGRLASPPRLVAGLMYLQHLNRQSDEAIVAHWLENSYLHDFTGETFFQHQPPNHLSSPQPMA